MSKLTSLLTERFAKKEKSKVTALATQSSDGALSSFTGIFGSKKLGEEEQEKLKEILKKYSPETACDLEQDLSILSSISSEVKAITVQSAILHGERIKKAQEVLKKYKDGAFTAWLLETYGNRQTPYNFLQYYEFHQVMPKGLHPLIEAMPRQAVYTLASRKGQLEKKEEIIKNYKGETKEEILSLIRSRFPLSEKDGRKEDIIKAAMTSLERVQAALSAYKGTTTAEEKEKALVLIEKIYSMVEEL